MAFVLAGLVHRAGAAPRASGVREVVPLPQGFELLRLAPGGGPSVFDGMDRLDADAAGVAAELSAGGRVVYLEAEFFGGEGTQAAVGWESGDVGFGPRLTQTTREDREGFEPIEPGGAMAIDEALRWLGVEVGDAHDEFDALGLGHLDESRMSWDQESRRGDSNP